LRCRSSSISASGARLYPIKSAVECAGGHFYNFYPVAVGALVTPVVFALDKGIGAAQPLLAPLAARASSDARRTFLLGDLAGGSSIVEVIIASLIVAMASVVMYLVARQFLALPHSVLLALVFAFCTPAWSTASRALWQHGPSILLLSLAMFFLGKGPEDRRCVALLAAALALAFYIRPTNVVAIAALSIFVLVHHRKQALPYVLGMVPVALGFTAYNLSAYGSLLAPYSFVRRAAGGGLALHSAFPEALAGHLISPSRGLFIYTPLFVLAIAGMFLAPPSETARRLRPFLVAILIGHWLLISSFELWSGGHCYGPRYFSDMTPIFVWFLIPILLRARKRIVAASFTVLAAVSFFMHYEGATQWSCMLWNVEPVEIGSRPSRIWDWRDPQFLRGVR